MAKKPSREDLDKQIKELATDNGLMHCAVNSIVEKQVTWFGRGVYKLGIAEPMAAHGGIVFVRHAPGTQKPFTAVHYWVEWHQVISRQSPPENAKPNDERLILQKLTHEVWQWMNQQKLARREQY